MKAECALAPIQPQTFDSAILGFPWFRLGPVELPDLEHHVASIRMLVTQQSLRAGVDTKIPSEDLALRDRLLTEGFREICLQLTWECPLGPGDGRGPALAEVRDRMELDELTQLRHARGFVHDRFHQDPRLPAGAADALMQQWIRNSLGGGKRVAWLGDGFCTFSLKEGLAVIDLVSVLSSGRGLGTSVVQETLRTAAREGASAVRVTTEVSNLRAWKLYQSLGFRLVAIPRILHLHLETVAGGV